MYSPRSTCIPYMTKNHKIKKNTLERKAEQHANRKRPVAKPRTDLHPKSNYPSIGAQIGDGLQKWGTSIFNKIIGNGDYTMSSDMASIKRNDLFADSRNQPPSFAGSDHSFLFEHSEYITDITSSATIGAFTTQSFTVNPSNSVTFPWLSGLAQNFESYEIEGMIFRFESTSGTAVSNTNSQLGSVMASFVYDAQDPAFINKSQMLQYDGVVDARSSENFLVGVECAKGANVISTLYNGSPPTGADAKFYNFGKLHIASQGMQAASQVIGELWVHYKIRMKITKDVNNDLQSMHIAAGSGVTSAAQFGDTTRVTTGNLTNSVSGNVVTLTNCTPGTIYLYRYGTKSNTMTVFSHIVGLDSGQATLYNLFNQGTESSESSPDPTNSVMSVAFKAITSKVVITASGTLTATSISSSDLTITPLDLNTI